MKRLLVAVAATVLLAGCETTPSLYDDALQLGRGQAEFDVASAQCEMFAYNVANQQMGNAAAGGLVLGSDYMLIAGLAGKERNYKTCLKANGWRERPSTQ